MVERAGITLPDLGVVILLLSSNGVPKVNMLTRFLTKLRRDKGDSTLVSTIIVLPLILGILITMIDVAVYFSNRGQMLNIARDGARLTAIYGGDGNATHATPLEIAYGQSRTTTCAGINAMPRVQQAFDNVVSSAVECGIMRNVANSIGFVSVRLVSVQCGAADASGNFTGHQTVNMGQQVGCELRWAYDSIPGSGLGFLNRARSMGFGNETLETMTHVIKVNSTSEVNLNGIPLQGW